MNSGALRLISGVGSKGPACFLLETDGKLEIGFKPERYAALFGGP